MDSRAHAAALVAPALGWLAIAALGWESVRRAPTPRGRWWLWAAIALLAFRWPLLWVSHQFNPDESQLIAGAITLAHDPMFWRSVDGGTAGPLDFFPLLPAAWADGTGSFAIARFIDLGAVFGALFFAAEALALLVGVTAARLAVLPAVMFHAFTSAPDFTHYSTEVVPVLLLAAAAYVAAHELPDRPRARLWFIALLLGGVPWAKPQAAPFAALLWALIAWRERALRPNQSLLPLLVGPLVPALICVGAVTLAGQAEHLFVPYLLRNVNYVRDAPLPWSERALLQWRNAELDGFLGFWLAGTAVFFAVALLAWRHASTSQRRLVGVAGALLALGLWTVTTPSRPSMHHLLLVTLPLVWFAGAALAASDLANRRALVVGVFLGCCALPQVVWRASVGDMFRGIHEAQLSAAHHQLAALVRQLVGRDEPLATWGWRCSLYVEAGRRQATREAHTEAQIYQNPYQGYFLRRYLEDFQRSNPPLFVDAVGPGNFAFENRDRAHEAFPPLRAWVQDRYTLIADLDGTRVFLRNDRVPALAAAAPATR